jgi:hypothetical protein
MIEVYQGELSVATALPGTYVVTGVTVVQKMFDSETGDRSDQESTPAYEVTEVGSSKIVSVDISEVSGWPSPFYIKVDILLNGDPHFVKTDCNVVVPYATGDQIIESGNFSMDPDDSNYKSPSQIRDAEAIARHVIEAYTGRYFGRTYDKWQLQGTDSTVLFSDEHVLWAGAVFHDDDAIYSSTTGSYEVSDSGHCLSVKDDAGEAYGFPENYSYSLVGIFGENFVPYDVSIAAKMLSVHYLCADSAIQNNYIDQTKFGESANRYNRLAFVGTGLQAVDTLLNHYRFHNYKVL